MWPTPPAARPRALHRRQGRLPALTWLIMLAIAGLMLFAPHRAEAASNCITTVSSGGFGAVDVLAGGTLNTTATLTFACTGMIPGLPVTLCPNIDSGTGGGDGSGGRLLAGSSGGSLSFQIYQDAGRTQPWGSSSFLAFGTTPTITVTPNGSGAASTTQTLYATVTAASSAKPGAYSSSFSSQNFFWGLNLLSCAGITLGTTISPATFTFSANVGANCLVNATPLSFGTVGLLTASVTAQNQINVTCTNTTPYSLSLNNGLTGTAPLARQMTKGANQVTYGIYKDSGFTQPWGDVSQGAGFVQSGTGLGSAQLFNAYGKVPAQSSVPAGAYADTVVATLTY